MKPSSPPGLRPSAPPSRAANPRRHGAELLICGVGIERPFDVTLNTVEALRRCEIAFTDASHGELLEFLGTVCPRVEPLEGGRERAWKAVRAALAAGKRAAFVTYGHPLLFSEGNVMADACEREGFAWRALAAPSAIDSILARESKTFQASGAGFLVLNAPGLAAGRGGLLPSVATLVYGVSDVLRPGLFKKFCARLAAAYPASHPVLCLRCSDGTAAEARSHSTVGALPGLRERLDPAVSLVLPALGESPK